MVLHAFHSIPIHLDDELQYNAGFTDSCNCFGASGVLRFKEKLHSNVQIILLFCSILDANYNDSKAYS